MALPRNITAGAKTESLTKFGAKYIAMVKLKFDSGDERLWNGRSNLLANVGEGAETFTGGGFLGSISPIEESQEQRPFGVSITVSGLPLSKDFLALAEAEDIIGRTGQVWLAFLDDDYIVISDPVLMFQGLMDTMTISVGKTMSIVVSLENRLADWDRARIRRWTSASHKQFFPDDDGYEFVQDSVEKEIVWGAKPAKGKGGGGVSSSSNESTAAMGSEGAGTITAPAPSPGDRHA